jgi:hypothetical protein
MEGTVRSLNRGPVNGRSIGHRRARARGSALGQSRRPVGGEWRACEQRSSGNEPQATNFVLCPPDNGLWTVSDEERGGDVRTTTATNTSSEQRASARARVASVSPESIAVFAPNKPMVPTATAALAEPALPSWRRHIGQPLERK